MSDEAILGFARRAIPPQHLRRMLDAAGEVRAGAGRFVREIDAERVLRTDMPNALAGRPGRALEPSGKRNLRYLDVIDPVARKAVEVKHGYAPDAGRAGVQLSKDVQMVATRANADVRTVEWHFFADRDGIFGTDEFLLQDLIANNVPFVIHLP